MVTRKLSDCVCSSIPVNSQLVCLSERGRRVGLTSSAILSLPPWKVLLKSQDR